MTVGLCAINGAEMRRRIRESTERLQCPAKASRRQDDGQEARVFKMIVSVVDEQRLQRSEGPCSSQKLWRTLNRKYIKRLKCKSEAGKRRESGEMQVIFMFGQRRERSGEVGHQSSK